MKKWIVAGSIVVILVIGVVVTGLILVNARLMQEVDVSGKIVTIPQEVQTVPELQEKVSTFLVLGIADDEDERASTNLTDVMMVVTFDFEENSAAILQIPRDTYVGSLTDNTKINALYQQSAETASYSGLDGVMRYLYDNFKINIDHYVTMRMDNFADIVDALGGVEINVPEKMSYGGVTLESGEQVLNGEEALVLVRTRKIYFNADLGRLDAQKLFLSALAKQCLDADFNTMTKLVPTIFDCVSTDLTAAEALSYYNAVKNLSLDELVITTAPGTDGMHNGQSVFSIFPNHMATLLNDYFRPYSDAVPVEELAFSTIYQYEPSLEEQPLEVKSFSYLLMTEEEQAVYDEQQQLASQAAVEQAASEMALQSETTTEPAE